MGRQTGDAACLPYFAPFFKNIGHLLSGRTIYIHDRSKEPGKGNRQTMMQTTLDKETFCTQVIRNQEAMFRSARSILHTDEDAEDAVQEAICAAFASRGNLRDPEKFKSWILRILVNKCYDICRKQRPVVDLAEVENYLPDDGPDPTERMTLWQAVQSLDDSLRLTVTLFYYEGFSIREIGAIMEVSETAVKKRLSRGRARLRQLLQEE